MEKFSFVVGRAKVFHHLDWSVRCVQGDSSVVKVLNFEDDLSECSSKEFVKEANDSGWLGWEVSPTRLVDAFTMTDRVLVDMATATSFESSSQSQKVHTSDSPRSSQDEVQSPSASTKVKNMAERLKSVSKNNCCVIS